MRVLYWVLQWTWGIVQNLLGGLLTLFLLKREHMCYRGAFVTRWRLGGSMGLGMFIFLGKTLPETESQILVHEFGHTVQSAILGPLYLPVIGLPSVVWANLPAFAKLRRKRRISYYRAYQEHWANHLGERVTKLRSPGQKEI